METNQPTASVRRFPIATRLLINGEICRVHATVTESIDLKTGDQVEQVSIDEIISTGGQTLHPIALGEKTFRTLVQNVKAYIPEI